MKASNPHIKSQSMRGVKFYTVVAETEGKYNQEYFQTFQNMTNAGEIVKQVEESGEINEEYWNATYSK